MLTACTFCKAQNLVPNGDFEFFSGCPTNYSQINNATPWQVPTFLNSSDYYNACATNATVGVPVNISMNGFQFAHSGVAYGGIYLYFLPTGSREYIEVPLTSPLSAGAHYHFEMFVNLYNLSGLTCSAIGAYLSDTLLHDIPIFTAIPFLPQLNNTPGVYFDTLNWTHISADYTAAGGESYLTIGNFMDNSNSDTMRVNPSGFSYVYVYIDDISLTLLTGIDEEKENPEINIYPNPFADKINITTRTKDLFEFKLYDVMERIIFHQSFVNSTSINASHLSNGIYMYEVRNKNGVIKKGKVVKD